MQFKEATSGDDYFSIVNSDKFIYRDQKFFSIQNPDYYLNLENSSPFDVDPDKFVVSEIGEVTEYVSGIEGEDGVFYFHSFEFPEKLKQLTNGLFAQTTEAGTLTIYKLGITGPLLESRMKIFSKDETPFDLIVSGYNPEIDDYEEITSLTNVNVQSGDILFINYPYQVKKENTSPTLDDLFEQTDFTIGTSLNSFLVTKGLTNLLEIRKAGKLSALPDFPVDANTVEVSKLEAYADFYSISNDLAIAQKLIEADYLSSITIAKKQREDFVSELAEDIGSYNAAKTHHSAVQRYKLLSNLFVSLEKRQNYPNEVTYDKNTNEAINLSSFFNSISTTQCSCDDCTSVVSPFAYLLDLIRYASRKIKVSTSSKTPEQWAAELSSNYFQPYDSMQITCEVLNQQFCQVRLCIEVLRKMIDAGTELPSEKATILALKEKEYRKLAYRTILRNLGTSYEEIRNLQTTSMITNEEAQQKFCSKLGVPLRYDDEYTSIALYKDLENEGLTEAWLESTFGLRDTNRNVNTNPSESLLSILYKLNLQAVWITEDYPESSYSRETSSNQNIQRLPIVDPDLISLDNIRDYDLDNEGAPTKDNNVTTLYFHRREWLDSLASFDGSVSGYLVKRNFDFAEGSFYIQGADLTSDRLQLTKEVKLNDGSFLVPFSRSLQGTETRFILPSSTIPAYNITDYPVNKLEINLMYNIESFSIDTSLSLNIITGKNNGWTLVKSILENNPSSEYPIIVFYKETEEDEIYHSAASSITSIGTYDDLTGKIVIDLDIEFLSDIPTYSSLNELKIKLVYDSNDETPSFIYEEVAGEVVAPQGILLKTETLIEPMKWLFSLNSNSLTYNGENYFSPLYDNTLITANDFYFELKSRFEDISNGIETQLHLDWLKEIGLPSRLFQRLMKLTNDLQQHFSNPFTNTLSINDIDEWRTCIVFIHKVGVRTLWLEEEAAMNFSGTYPDELKLDYNWFQKSISQNEAGLYNANYFVNSFKKDPESPTTKVFLDPERYKVNNLLLNHITSEYKITLTERLEILNEKFEDFSNSLQITSGVNPYIEVLNDDILLTGDTAPYISFDDFKIANNQINNQDVFQRQIVIDNLHQFYGLDPQAFAHIYKCMDRFENQDPSVNPSASDINKAAHIFTKAFKFIQLYPTWSDEDSTLDYYKIFQLNQQTWLFNESNLANWNIALKQRNSYTIVDPDLVNPDNIVRFETGQPIYELYLTRRDELIDLETNFKTLFIEAAEEDLLDNFKDAIRKYVFHDFRTTFTSGDSYARIALLRSKNILGERITDELTQIGLDLNSFKLISDIDLVLSDDISADTNVSSDEWLSLIDLLIKLYKDKTYALWRNIEFSLEPDGTGSSPLILSGDYFCEEEENYSPYIISEAIQKSTYRKSDRAKHSWLTKLKGRIELQKNILNGLDNVIDEVEDELLKFLRDSLLVALSTGCETLEETAQRIGKKLHIETQNNCCARTTRVSQAIETLQNIFFTLKQGIFITPPNYSLNPQNFDEEWVWMGSYASWRSAVFVYIYPENLLHPNLMKPVSRKFKEIRNQINQASNFSKEAACDIAKNFSEYISDLPSLTISWVTYTKYFVNQSTEDCCNTESLSPQQVIFRFATAKSGRKYYSIMSNIENESLDPYCDEWIQLEVESNFDIISAVQNDSDYNELGNPRSSKIYLSLLSDDANAKIKFYTFDLLKPFSSWQEFDTYDIPDLKLSKSKKNRKVNPYRAIGVTSRFPWEGPQFIVSYKVGGESGYNALIFLNKNELNHSFNIFPEFETVNAFLESDLKKDDDFLNIEDICVPIIGQPVGADRLISFEQSNSIKWGVAVVFENEDGSNTRLIFNWYISDAIITKTQNAVFDVALESYLSANFSYKFNFKGIFSNQHKLTLEKFNGFFYFREENAVSGNGQVLHTYAKFGNNFSIIQWLNGESNFNFGVVFDDLINQTPNAIPIPLRTYKIKSNQIPNISAQSIIPNNPNSFIILPFSTNGVISNSFVDFYPQLILDDNHISVIKISKSLTHPTFSISNKKYIYNKSELSISENIIQSSNCITDVGLHFNEAKTAFDSLNEDIDSPGNSGDEAFYGLPMLLAFKFHQLGQYEEALSWFRSVYDYTQKASNYRKIYPRLRTESYLQNSFERMEDWLGDPLNPHLIAKTRNNAYTKYTLLSIVSCILDYADQLFTIDTVESVPQARLLYSLAEKLLDQNELKLRGIDCIEDEGCLDILNPLLADYDALQGRLKRSLSKYHSPTQRAVVIDHLIEIFEGDDKDENYADAFAYVNSTVADNPPIESITDSLGNLQITSDQAKSLASLIGYSDYEENLLVRSGSGLDTFVSVISDLAISELIDPANEEKLNWLANTPSGEIKSTGWRNTSSSKLNLPGQISSIDNRLISAQVNQIEVFPEGCFPQEPKTPLVPIVKEQSLEAIELFETRPSFCIAPNPIVGAYVKRTKNNLFKILNCRNIAGIVRELNNYSTQSDASLGVPFIGADGSFNLPELNKSIPTLYRFPVLLDRSKLLVSQAQQLEGMLLSTIEKRDAEAYSRIKAKQEISNAKSTLKLQNLRLAQADNEITNANIQLNKNNFVSDYYKGLITEGLSDLEETALILMNLATATQALSAYSSYTEAGFSFINGKIPSLSQAYSQTASVFSSTASILQTQASYQRRAQEWFFQELVSRFEVQLSKQQLKIAQQNLRIVGQENAISEQNLGFAEDTFEFLSNKFTNRELYDWMIGVIQNTYSYFLNLATSTAKTAETQLVFERQLDSGNIIQNDYWNTQGSSFSSSEGNIDRLGLTGSVRLLQDITRLDQFAFETDKRKLQLTKTISLAQLFPVEFQQFKSTGVLNFEISLNQFDRDFPGHYLRLIKAVRTSVIALIPPVDGIKASLTAGNISYVVTGGNIYNKIPIRRYDIEQVALTSPSNATGVFELQQQNNTMYNPFEGMGVESRWEFKMPKFSNAFDFDSIADIQLSIDYTALNSFDYQVQVLQEIDRTTSFNRAFSLKNDFPDQWYELTNLAQNSEDGSSPITGNFGVTFELRKDQFPPNVDILNVGNLALFFARDESYMDEITIAGFAYSPNNLQSISNPVEITSDRGIISVIRGNGGPLVSAMSLINSNEDGGKPFGRFRIEFPDLSISRDLFLEEYLEDILFVVTCNGELPQYPI